MFSEFRSCMHSDVASSSRFSVLAEFCPRKSHGRVKGRIFRGRHAECEPGDETVERVRLAQTLDQVSIRADHNKTASSALVLGKRKSSSGLSILYSTDGRNRFSYTRLAGYTEACYAACENRQCPLSHSESSKTTHRQFMA